MLPQLSVETLLAGNFSLLGCWKLSERASLVLSGSAPNLPGVYAFAHDGVVQYVGVASTSLAKRLYFYGKPGPTQKTNIRLNAALRDLLEKGSEIEIYVATPPALEWSGWIVSGSEGLEAGIIKSYTLPWNMRGSARIADAPTSEPAQALQLSPKSDQLVPSQTAGVGKYQPLCEHLLGCPQDKVSMTFAQIEQLVGPLPKSARVHRAWWGNHEGNSQAKGWMKASFLAEPDPAHRSVVFRRFSY